VIFKQTYASCLSADEQLSLIAQALPYSSPSSLWQEYCRIWEEKSMKYFYYTATKK